MLLISPDLACSRRCSYLRIVCTVHTIELILNLIQNGSLINSHLLQFCFFISFFFSASFSFLHFFTKKSPCLQSSFPSSLLTFFLSRTSSLSHEFFHFITKVFFSAIQKNINKHSDRPLPLGQPRKKACLIVFCSFMFLL